MTTQELMAKWGSSMGWESFDDIETYRKRVGGRFDVTVKDRFGAIKDTESCENIVTNQGLNYILDAGLSGGAAISAWYVTLADADQAESATMTYQTPVFSEIDNVAAGVTETIRQAWSDGGVATQSVDNSASPATYTANTSGFTAWAAALVGGGTAPTAFGDTHASGILYAYSKFATQKALSSTDTIDVTYTFTAADDGV
jgi:hypothetical protein